MEHDIRNLFKVNEVSEKEIPQFHREEFLNKLNRQHKNQKGFQNNNKFIAVASIAIILISAFFYFNTNPKIEKTPFQIQLAEIEEEYLTNINKEWKNFIELAEDSVLVNKYKIKMRDFDKDYKKITKELDKTPNNINVLESLIDNLQRRLELIKSIKEHIKELNQKNTSNETIYI